MPLVEVWIKDFPPKPKSLKVPQFTNTGLPEARRRSDGGIHWRRPIIHNRVTAKDVLSLTTLVIRLLNVSLGCDVVGDPDYCGTKLLRTF